MRDRNLKHLFQRIVMSTLPLAASAALAGCGRGGFDCPPTVYVPETTLVRVDGGIPDGGLTPSECQALCSPSAVSCTPAAIDGGVAVACTFNVPQNGACGGRRPCGFTPTEEAPGHSEIGRTLFLLAQLERASVDAFEILAAELLLHGAPAKLVAAANQAADDEVRHTRMMRRLAQHYDGGRPCEVACPEYRRAEARSLEEIATENAMEGCVRESFGALLALWQEQVASERRIRQAMRVIAQDETRHAELAWEVALFCDPRLTPAAKKRVRKARTEAMSALSRELATDPAPELVLKLGLPSAAQAQALLLGMQQSLPA